MELYSQSDSSCRKYKLGRTEVICSASEWGKVWAEAMFDLEQQVRSASPSCLPSLLTFNIKLPFFLRSPETSNFSFMPSNDSSNKAIWATEDQGVDCHLFGFWTQENVERRRIYLKYTPILHLNSLAIGS